MQTYIVLRRSAWETEEELESATALSLNTEEEYLSDQVQWIRSYVLEEEDGTLGLMDVYQAEDEDALAEHAQRAELPADEIIPVADMVIIRDDP